MEKQMFPLLQAVTSQSRWQKDEKALCPPPKLSSRTVAQFGRPKLLFETCKLKANLHHTMPALHLGSTGLVQSRAVFHLLNAAALGRNCDKAMKVKGDRPKKRQLVLSWRSLVDFSRTFFSLPALQHRLRRQLQSLLLDPLELDLLRLLLRRTGDLFRCPLRLLPRPSLLELELELDDLELELGDRLRRIRPLRELPPPREPSEDEPLSLRRLLRPLLVRLLSLLPPPSDDEDEVDDEDDDRRRRRCDNDLFRPRLRLLDRERDDSNSSFPRRDTSLVVLVADRE